MKSKLWAALLLAIAPAAMAQSAASRLDTARARMFLGDWILTVESGRGPQDRPLHITDVESHVANRVDAESGIPVPARPLDDILADLGITEPTLVKMNIEGAEVAALRGAERPLRAGTRWIVSCHDFIVGDDPALKTYGPVTKKFRDAGLVVRQPRADGRPWIPYYVYAERTSS